MKESWQQAQYQHQASLVELRAHVQREQDRVRNLFKKIEQVKGEQQVWMQIEQDKFQLLLKQEKDEKQRQDTLQHASSLILTEEMKKVYEDQLQGLQDQVDALQVKHQVVSQEMKKKGDAARKLLAERDEEIHLLKHQLQKFKSDKNCVGMQATHVIEQEQERIEQHQPQLAASGHMDMQEMRIIETPRQTSKRDQIAWKQRDIEDILIHEEKRIFKETARDKPGITTAFTEELFRRAVLREAELMESVRILKSEVNSMRSRQSILSSTRKVVEVSRPHGSDLHLQRSRHGNIYSEHNGLEMLSSTDVPSTPRAGDYEEAADTTMMTMTLAEEAEREQRLVYLRQAFCGFFKAKQTVEMQHLARVICAILGVSLEEQDSIMENIIRLSPAVVATSTIEMFSQQFASIFS
jgi:hypothetical protein